MDDTEIEREAVIGKGTFGSVWRGTMKATGEVVAIKDMPYPSKKEVEMWKKEVQLLRYVTTAATITAPHKRLKNIQTVLVHE